MYLNHPRSSRNSSNHVLIEYNVSPSFPFPHSCVCRSVWHSCLQNCSPQRFCLLRLSPLRSALAFVEPPSAPLSTHVCGTTQAVHDTSVNNTRPLSQSSCFSPSLSWTTFLFWVVRSASPSISMRAMSTCPVCSGGVRQCFLIFLNFSVLPCLPPQ